MADLLFSNKAVEDLTHIWNYTVETWSEAQADKYYAMLVATCRQIADSSRPLGREYTEIMAELYGYRTGKHIVFYRTVSGECRRDRENPARTHGFETPHRRVRFGITGKPTAVPSACSLDIALFLPAAPAPAAALFNSAFDLLDICGKLGQQVVYILFACFHLLRRGLYAFFSLSLLFQLPRSLLPPPLPEDIRAWCGCTASSINVATVI